MIETRQALPILTTLWRTTGWMAMAAAPLFLLSGSVFLISVMTQKGIYATFLLVDAVGMILIMSLYATVLAAVSLLVAWLCLRRKFISWVRHGMLVCCVLFLNLFLMNGGLHAAKYQILKAQQNNPEFMIRLSEGRQP
ncbi:MAG: hypothetical protein H7833_06825 [Magnetococcus sp. DMHC-1]|nr:hypothetical protein [Magnetococcales bacterium]